jgi:hypothetical protein
VRAVFIFGIFEPTIKPNTQMQYNHLKATRKSELQELLKGFSKRIVRKEIQEVIVDVRNVSIKEAKDIKTLYPSEVQEVLNRFK